MIPIELDELPGQSIRPSQRKCLYKCECGNEFVTRRYHVKGGHTQSCGCLRKEKFLGWVTKHGGHYSSEYSCWSSMKSRRQNVNDSAYDHYGGRGITVSDEWQSFDNFLEDMGPRPEGMSIERKNNDKGYCSDNCVWANKSTQARNRRNTRLLNYNGKLNV